MKRMCFLIREIISLFLTCGQRQKSKTRRDGTHRMRKKSSEKLPRIKYWNIYGTTFRRRVFWRCNHLPFWCRMMKVRSVVGGKVLLICNSELFGNCFSEWNSELRVKKQANRNTFISMLFRCNVLEMRERKKNVLTCFIALAVNRCKAAGLFLASLNYCYKFVAQ